jgi:hypothetical protein
MEGIKCRYDGFSADISADMTDISAVCMHAVVMLYACMYAGVMLSVQMLKKAWIGRQSLTVSRSCPLAVVMIMLLVSMRPAHWLLLLLFCTR